MTIDWVNFTPVAAVIGGVLIGLSAALLWTLQGRIAGISGIIGGLIGTSPSGIGWRLAFIAGLISGYLAYAGMIPGMPPLEITSSVPLLIIGGLLVGFGTRLGSGCTSGHGVCGIARLSPRSLVATVIFIAVAIATVTIVRVGLGG